MVTNPKKKRASNLENDSLSIFLFFLQRKVGGLMEPAHSEHSLGFR